MWHIHGVGVCRRRNKPRGKQSSGIQHAMKTGHAHICFLLLRNTTYSGWESGNSEITFEPDGFDVFLEQFSERQAVA